MHRGEGRGRGRRVGGERERESGGDRECKRREFIEVIDLGSVGQNGIHAHWINRFKLQFYAEALINFMRLVTAGHGQLAPRKQTCQGVESF